MDSSNTYIYDLRTQISFPPEIMKKVPTKTNMLIKETFTLSFPDKVSGPRTVYRTLAVSASPFQGIQVFSTSLNISSPYQILQQDLGIWGERMELLVDKQQAPKDSVMDQILATVTPCFVGCEFPLFYSGNGKNTYVTLGTKQVNPQSMLLFFPNQPVWHGNYTILMNYEAYGLINLNYEKPDHRCYIYAFFNPWFGNFFVRNPLTVEFVLPPNIRPEDVEIDLNLDPLTTEEDPRANFYLYKKFKWIPKRFTANLIRNHFHDYCVTKSLTAAGNTTKLTFDSSCFQNFRMDYDDDTKGISALFALKLMTGDWRIQVKWPFVALNEWDCKLANQDFFSIKPDMPTTVANNVLIRLFSIISIMFFFFLVVLSVLCVFASGICGNLDFWCGFNSVHYLHVDRPEGFLNKSKKISQKKR